MFALNNFLFDLFGMVYMDQYGIGSRDTITSSFFGRAEPAILWVRSQLRRIIIIIFHAEPRLNLTSFSNSIQCT